MALLHLDTVPTWDMADCELLPAIAASRLAGEEAEGDDLTDDDGNDFNLYPNPNAGQMNLALKACGDSEAVYQVTVNDVIGKLLYTEQANCGSTLQMDLRNLNKGTYIVNVRSIDQEEQWSTKLIIMQ